jgi:hypothetical protein
MKTALLFTAGAALLCACGVDDESVSSDALTQAVVTQKADLRVSLSGPASVLASSTNDYQLLLRNTGQKVANSSQVMVTLPAGASLGAPTTGCTANGSSVLCTYGNLAAGGSVTRTLSLVSPAVAGTVQISAQASTTSQELYLSNNSATLTVGVNPLPVAIPLSPPQAMNVKACFGVSFYAQCVPEALVEEDILLNADNSITVGSPDYTGIWSQPNGPTSLRLQFFQQPGGNQTIQYDGTGVSATCFEGTGAGPTVPGAAFRGCLY